MKKLLLTAAIVGALAAPAAPAAASDIPQPAGTKPCPAGFVGVIVWVNTQPTGYRELSFCFHA
jgi:hypothetical protein